MGTILGLVFSLVLCPSNGLRGYYDIPMKTPRAIRPATTPIVISGPIFGTALEVQFQDALSLEPTKGREGEVDEP